VNRRITIALFSLVAPAVVVGFAAAGCDDLQVHPFFGSRYDPARDCVESPAVLDVLEGPDPGRCETIRCYEAPEGDDVFITDGACDAPDGYVDRTNDAKSPCADALTAYAREGHSRCPAPSDSGA